MLHMPIVKWLGLTLASLHEYFFIYGMDSEGIQKKAKKELTQHKNQLPCLLNVCGKCQKKP